MTTSIIGRTERRDIARDRARQIRDHLLAKLEAGPLSPAELARRAGLGVCAVVRCAHDFPAYFAVDHDGSSGKPRAVLIDRHHHLKTTP